MKYVHINYVVVLRNKRVLSVELFLALTRLDSRILKENYTVDSR